MMNFKHIILVPVLLMIVTGIHAQDNGLNPVFTVSVNDLQYNIAEKKASVGSVLGTIAEAVAGQSSDNDHQDMVPAVNAAVKSAVAGVRRLSAVENTDSADFCLSGEVTRISTTTKVRTIEEKDSKGKVVKRNVNEYEGTVSVSLTLKNQTTGEVNTNTFSGSAGWLDDARTENDALTLSVNEMKKKIIKYFNAMFPLSANIIERGNEKKDKAKEMYIDLGSYAGTYKGQRFSVYLIGTVAGRETRKKVGRLKVTEIMGDDISLCKVTSGGKDIKSSFDAGENLLVISEE